MGASAICASFTNKEKLSQKLTSGLCLDFMTIPASFYFCNFIFLNPQAYILGFPGGSVVKNLPDNAGDTGDLSLIHGSARSPGEGNGKLL